MTIPIFCAAVPLKATDVYVCVCVYVHNTSISHIYVHRFYIVAYLSSILSAYNLIKSSYGPFN